MKIFLALIAHWLLAASLANAQCRFQPIASGDGTLNRSRGNVSQILGRQFAADAKTNSLAERLIEMSAYDQGVFTDSVEFFYYTNNRGAAHDPKNPMSYHDVYEPIRNSWSDYGQRTQYMKYDVSQPVFGWQSYDFKVRQNTYDSANRLVRMDIGEIVSRERYTLLHNTDGDVIRYQRFRDTLPGTGAPAYRLEHTQYCRYDAAHRLIQDSVHTEPNAIPFANPDRRFLYTYDAAGRLTTTEFQYIDSNGTWESFHRAIDIYYPNGLLQSEVQEWKDSVGWTPYEKDSFGYAGTNPSYTYYRNSYYHPDSLRFISLGYTMLQLNAAGNWDTLRSYRDGDDPSVVPPSALEVITYTPFENRASYRYYIDGDGNGIVDATDYSAFYYYYELYQPTSVNAAAAPAVYTISPNPTSGLLHLEWNRHTEATRYTITDLQGRTISTGLVTAGASRTELDLSAQAPGIYVLAVMDESGAVMHREKIVRQ